MQAVIFIGTQATGKSTFYKERFADTHIRINYDMLNTRRKESLLLEACLAMPHPFVVDNTNPRKADRAAYITKAKERHFEVAGYYFQSVLRDALLRNEGRAGKARIPDAGLHGAAASLELPEFSEGFDTLYYVTMAGDGSFLVSDWKIAP